VTEADGEETVTADLSREPDLPEPGRRENGLLADTYVPLTDVTSELGDELLVALRRSRIAAYLADAPAPAVALRLYVAAEERADARTIAAAVIKAASGEELAAADPLAGIDAEAEFAALVADWHVDTHTAIRAAEKSLTQEDEDWRARLVPPPTPAEPVWLDEEHYVPPVPPPLPRFAAPTILAMAVLAISILVLGLGGELGLANRLTLLLGVCGVLLGATMLVMRLRATPDEDDDGAIL
jgi:hypothetical protein